MGVGGKDPKTTVTARATNRPLYRYQGNMKIFHCPSDRGDAGVWHPTLPNKT